MEWQSHLVNIIIRGSKNCIDVAEMANYPSISIFSFLYFSKTVAWSAWLHILASRMVRYGHVCDQVLPSGAEADVMCHSQAADCFLYSLPNQNQVLATTHSNMCIMAMPLEHCWRKDRRNLVPSMIAYSRTAHLELQLPHEKETSTSFKPLHFGSLFVAVASVSLTI